MKKFKEPKGEIKMFSTIFDLLPSCIKKSYIRKTEETSTTLKIKIIPHMSWIVSIISLIPATFFLKDAIEDLLSGSAFEIFWLIPLALIPFGLLLLLNKITVLEFDNSTDSLKVRWYNLFSEKTCSYKISDIEEITVGELPKDSNIRIIMVTKKGELEPLANLFVFWKGGLFRRDDSAQREDLFNMKKRINAFIGKKLVKYNPKDIGAHK